MKDEPTQEDDETAITCIGHSSVVTEDPLEKSIDDILGLEMISLRIDQELVEDLTKLATSKGIIVKALIRQVLQEYVEKGLQKPEDVI